MNRIEILLMLLLLLLITFDLVTLILLLPYYHYRYSLALEELKLHALRIRKNHLDSFFLIQVYLGLKFCPFVLEIVKIPCIHYIIDLPF